MKKRLTVVKTLILVLFALGLVVSPLTVQADASDDPPVPSWFKGIGVSDKPVDTPRKDGPNDGEVLLRAEDAGRQVALKDDQVLVVSLQANPSTGYQWEIDEIDGKRMRQVGEAEFRPSSSGLLGAPGQQIMRFQALKKGKAKLGLVYRRPWERETSSVKSFSVEIEGQGTFTGKPLSPAVPIPTPAPEPSTELPASEVQSTAGLPSAFDWCDQGGCTPVQDQGYCGSCWAFATAGAVESAIKIGDGLGRDVSEQYLVSCNTAELNYEACYDNSKWGCNGGWWAFHYYIDAVPPGEPDAGAVYEADFPYQASDASCDGPYDHHEKLLSYAYVDHWGSVPSTTDLKQAIYDHGPVAVAICSGSPSSPFHQYTGGVFSYDETACGDGVNHAVVLTGWDDSDGTWHLKNSWGTDWGENGYMRIKYGVSNVGYAAVYVDYEGSGSPYDFDGDGDVDVDDVNAVAAHWRHQEGDQCWDPQYDLDGDGIVTSVDITRVAAEWSS
jgi:inhibitor of cysteine peptidase